MLSGRLGFPLDDSWIHLHFARQLAGGEGLAYNTGQPVAGSTAPLWTALLSLGFLVPSAGLGWAKLLGVALLLATVDVTARLARELGLGDGTCRLAALLVATSHWLVWSALSAMEIPLFSCLSLWGILLHLRERRSELSPVISLPVLAAAALARPEGLLLFALAVVDRQLRFSAGPDGQSVSLAKIGRPWITGLLAALVALLPTLLFYRAISGSLLPTTFAVKGSAVGGLVPSGRYLRAVLDVLLRSQPILLLFAGAGVLRLVSRLGWRGDRGLLPALWPLGMALAYAMMAPPAAPVVVGNFGRYYFPLLPLVVVLGLLGARAAARSMHPRLLAGRFAIPAAAVGTALLLVPQLVGLAHGPARYLQTVANVEDSDVAAARWLAPRLPPPAVLAVQDIGALKFLLPETPIVDLTGIVNPDILPSLKGGGEEYWETRLLGYLEEKRPDYLVVFPRSYPWLTGAAAGFGKLRSFPIPDNVTMAGDELAVFSTPWTRFPLREIPPQPPEVSPR